VDWNGWDADVRERIDTWDNEIEITNVANEGIVQIRFSN
jgi:hypothetical protein